MAWLSGGNLNNGANAGRFYANLNNSLGNANWNHAARISEDENVSQYVSSLLKRLVKTWAECPKFLNQHRLSGNWQEAP